PGQAGRANLTNREFAYRPAFELGRHVIGYELQKILAAVDWFNTNPLSRDKPDWKPHGRPIGVAGLGEGAMLAMYAAAIDTRIDAAALSGHFRAREHIWNEPVDHNIFGLLQQ